MTNANPAARLKGKNVLIIEDEFYLAVELQEAVERAGGQVIGPCPDAAAGLNEMDKGRPDCAVVDINLGEGPSYEMAEALQRRNVPFVFLTGYDAPAIPSQFAGIERVEKPASINRVVEALAGLGQK